MLKRGYGATIEEWLMAAEYIVSSGNPNVILCERGIRTFETYTRNTLDLAAVPLLHHLTHLPVIVDPSHATGKRWLVRPLAHRRRRGGRRRGHGRGPPRPDEALSDAEQQLDLDEFRALMHDLVPSTSTCAASSTGRIRRRCTVDAVGRRRAARSTDGDNDGRGGASPDPVAPRPGACGASSGCPATSRSATGR